MMGGVAVLVGRGRGEERLSGERNGELGGGWGSDSSGGECRWW